MIAEVRNIILSTVSDLMSVGDSYAHEAAEEICKSLFGVYPGQLQEFQEGKDFPTTPKNFSAIQLGRMGGKKGGVIRAERLTPRKRSEIARKAANTRWKTSSAISILSTVAANTVKTSKEK